MLTDKKDYQLDIRKDKEFPELKKRFLSRIPEECLLPKNEDVCWPWQGISLGQRVFYGHGYGYIAWHNITYPAHRISYIIFNGLIPYGKVIRHKCNNRWCVNPNHLLLGTQIENAIDAVMAGTGGLQKLSEEDVLLIKWAFKHKPRARLAEDLAQVYDVSPSAISAIKRGLSWAWLELPDDYHPSKVKK